MKSRKNLCLDKQQIIVQVLLRICKRNQYRFWLTNCKFSDIASAGPVDNA